MTNTLPPISIDTNILIRLCILDLPEQVRAANKCLREHENIYVADTAIIESIFVLTRYYRFNRKHACGSLLAIFTHPNIKCNRTLFEKSFNLYVEHPALSIEDCYLAIHARFNNAAPLLTFDKKLAKQLQHVELLPVS